MKARRMVRTLALIWLLGGGVALGQGGPARTPSPLTPAPGAAEAALTRRAQTLVQSFYALRVEALWNAFTPELQAAYGNLDAFRAYRRGGLNEYGAEARVLSERTVVADGLTYYVRTAVFARHPEQAWSVVVGFEPSGRVSVFTIVLAGQAPEGDTLRTLLERVGVRVHLAFLGPHPPSPPTPEG